MNTETEKDNITQYDRAVINSLQHAVLAGIASHPSGDDLTRCYTLVIDRCNLLTPPQKMAWKRDWMLYLLANHPVSGAVYMPVEIAHYQA